nr:Rhodanese-related sulfurtransferase [Candidatus Pantoea persica]
MRAPLLTLFSHHSQGGLRERLCATLRQAIACGHLSFGQKVPLTRQLAGDLGLSRVTVEAAYAQLESEGYLSREVGRGTLVAIVMPSRATGVAASSTPHFSARGQAAIATGGC